MPKTYTGRQLANIYEKQTKAVVVQARFTVEFLGGQPGGENGVRAFVQHHLKLPPETEEFENAVKRILKEEIGERDVTPEGGEVNEVLTYGVNVIRRDDFGPYIGNWQVKAMLKAAASRLRIFVTKRGSKGDVAEVGRIAAAGASLNGDPRHLHLVDKNGAAVSTEFKRFPGRVNTGQGAKSIVHDTEVVAPGTLFAFEFRWYDKLLKEKDVAEMLAFGQQIGLGSARSLEKGKFEISSAEFL